MKIWDFQNGKEYGDILGEMQPGYQAAVHPEIFNGIGQLQNIISLDDILYYVLYMLIYCYDI